MKMRPKNKQSKTNMDYSGIEELIDAEQGLEFYSKDIVKKICNGFELPNNLKKDITVVEFGAGTGYLAELIQVEHGVKPICVEIDSNLVKALKDKGFFTLESLNEMKAPVDFIYTSNVLEHIEEDLLALQDIYKSLKIGGMLAVYVPALPMLYSGHDKKIGHVRRYKRKELIQKVSQVGFVVKSCFYNDCIGVLGALVIKLFGWKSKFGIGSRNSLEFYDKRIYPMSRLMDRALFSKLIGKNLFLFAVKKS